MVDLTELQRLAEVHYYRAASMPINPDTAKKLIAVALAAQRVVAEGADQWGAIPKLRTALEELK